MRSLILAAAAAFTLNAFSEVILECPEKGDWKDSPHLVQVDDDTLKSNGREIHSTEKFTVEPGKKYRITGEFKKNNPDKACLLFISFWCWTKDNQLINQNSVNVLPETMTELVTPVKKTDTTLMVKNAEKIQPGNKIVLGAREDLSDLPNFKITNAVVKKEKQADGNWLLTFKNKLYYEFPAGTKIRAHKNSGSYATAVIKHLTNDFQKIECFMQGSGVKLGQWFPGTAKADLVLFAPSAEFSFRNLQIEVVE